MIGKADIELTLKNAGVEVYDEAPGAPGGWFYTLGEMESGRYDGKLDAVLAGLHCAEELERLNKQFSKG